MARVSIPINCNSCGYDYEIVFNDMLDDGTVQYCCFCGEEIETREWDDDEE